MTKEPIVNRNNSENLLPEIKRRKRKMMGEHALDNVSYKSLFDLYVMCHEVTQDLINEYCLKLQTCHKATTINSYVFKISPTVKYGIEKGYIKEQVEFTHMVEQEEIKEIYTKAELEILLKKPTNNDFAEFRAWVIINTFLATGIRAGQLRALKVGNINLKEDYIILNKTKSREARILPIPTTLHIVLQEWLRIRNASKEDYLFCNIYGEQMQRSVLQTAIKRYSKRRGIEEVRALDDVIDADVGEMEYVEKGVVPIECIPVEMGLESQIEAIPDDLAVPMVDSFTSIESTDFGLSEDISVQDDFDLKADTRVKMPETYSEYSLLSVEEKVELFVISDYANSLDVMRLVKQCFQEIGHDYSIDEVMEESDEIYEGARQISIGKNAVRICNVLQEEGLSYWYLTVSEKAKLFEFRMDDNHYNLALHTAVLKKLGVEMDFDERYEDYQKVYETGLEMQRRDREKDRGR